MKRGNNELVPRARKTRLLIKAFGDDLNTDKAHSLNVSAAFVWQRCNGRRTISEVAEAMSKEFKVPVDDRTVWLAIDQLSRFDLLAERITRPAGVPRVSRRDMMRVVAAAAFALPLVISIVAPTAANAQTSINPSVCNARVQPNCGGTPCTGGSGSQTCQPFGAVGVGNPCKCQ